MPDIPPPADTIPCTDPATRAELGRVKVDDPETVRRKVGLAREAQRAWGQTSFAERRRVLRRLLDAVLDRADEICDRVVRDAGKTREHAMLGEVWPVCEKLRWTMRHAERHLRPERVSSGLMLHKRARLEFHPLGVVGAIIPWNYPFQNLMNPIIPALVSGNAVVVKPSEWVAWSSEQLVELVRDALVLEGHSPDLVQLAQGYGETGQALIDAPVDAILFIGSVRNGQRVLEAAARNITPVVLELGGKDPFIVCDDADLEQAAHAALAGCFISAGQNCVASERILVHRKVAADFEARVADLVGQFRQGPPGEGGTVDVGAMVTPMQLDIVHRLVQRAVDQGARVVTGGHQVMAERGDFFAPTVLADITPEMDIMREETFGPVMLLCPVEDDEQAIAVANGTAFGLSSSVFSKDRSRARAIARSLQSGMTAINEFGGMTYMAQELPFGGVKASGFGRMNGREGLRSFCNVKAVLDDRLPLTFANRLFPMSDQTYPRVRGVADLLYGGSTRQRLRGVRRLARSVVGRRDPEDQGGRHD